jgi:hypothetical protein
MARKVLLLILILDLTTGFCKAQAFIKTTDLLSRPGSPGSLNIDQNPAMDTLISRYILSKKKFRTEEGKQGMQGHRIQIYYSSVRAARDESAKVMASFINKFPEMNAYVQYQDPGWYMVRIGNYRSRTEAYKDLMTIKKEFPVAYIVPTTIFFPDLIKK